MDPEAFLQLFRQALEEIRDPIRYLDGREQSFQAALFAQLHNMLPRTIAEHRLRLEQEVTKSVARHGLDVRPDLILHIPFELGATASRTEGNAVVLELKVRASEEGARADYAKLARMCGELNYRMGIFLNVGAIESHRDQYQGPFNERLFGFAVRLQGDAVEVTGPVPTLGGTLLK